MLDVPNNQRLPVVRITVVLNARQDGNELRPRWVVRDNGGDFRTAAFTLHNSETRAIVRDRVDAEAERRMRHYCELGYAVEPWAVPS